MKKSDGNFFPLEVICYFCLDAQTLLSLFFKVQYFIGLCLELVALSRYRYVQVWCVFFQYVIPNLFFFFWKLLELLFLVFIFLPLFWVNSSEISITLCWIFFACLQYPSLYLKAYLSFIVFKFIKFFFSASLSLISFWNFFCFNFKLFPQLHHFIPQFFLIFFPKGENQLPPMKKYMMFMNNFGSWVFPNTDSHFSSIFDHFLDVFIVLI